MEWTHTFISLGITYDMKNFDKITDNNIIIKIGEIQKLIQIWKARFLTPFGKITIVKRLFLSKITHVLLSLPTPSEEMFELLESLFRNFIWGKKHPKFRKEIIENLPVLGGLKMTNIRNFDAALKLSWAKRWMRVGESFRKNMVFATYLDLVMNTL